MSFQQRLMQIISALGYSKNSFSDLLGYSSNSYIYDYTREDEKFKQPGFEFFQKLVQTKKGINIDWLLTGEGEAFNKKGTAATNNDEAAVNETLKSLSNSIAALTHANLVQAQTIAQLLPREVVKDG